jgi:hypothetical protein
MRRSTLLLLALVAAVLLVPAASGNDGTWINKGNKTLLLSGKFWDWPVTISWRWNCQNAGIHEGFDLDAIHESTSGLIKAFADSRRQSGNGHVVWHGRGLEKFRLRVQAHANCHWTVAWKGTES